jgi:hypothetical protein
VDEPVSVEGAPDTRSVDVLRIEIERISQLIRSREQSLQTAEQHKWNYKVQEHRRRISELQATLDAKQAQRDALAKQAQRDAPEKVRPSG